MHALPYYHWQGEELPQNMPLNAFTLALHEEEDSAFTTDDVIDLRTRARQWAACPVLRAVEALMPNSDDGFGLDAFDMLVEIIENSASPLEAIGFAMSRYECRSEEDRGIMERLGRACARHSPTLHSVCLEYPAMGWGLNINPLFGAWADAHEQQQQQHMDNTITVTISRISESDFPTENLARCIAQGVMIALDLIKIELDDDRDDVAFALQPFVATRIRVFEFSICYIASLRKAACIAQQCDGLQELDVHLNVTQEGDHNDALAFIRAIGALKFLKSLKLEITESPTSWRQQGTQNWPAVLAIIAALELLQDAIVARPVTFAHLHTLHIRKDLRVMPSSSSMQKLQQVAVINDLVDSILATWTEMQPQPKKAL